MGTFHGSVVLRNDGVDSDTGVADLNAGAGVYVKVEVSSTGGDAALLDLDDNAIPNPITADSKGNYAFKTADGTYNIIENLGPYQTVLSKVPIPEGYIDEDYVRYFDELSDAVTSTKLANGDKIYLENRTAGNGGGGMWSVVLASTVTPNTFNIVACTGVPTLALVMSEPEKQGPRSWGLVLNGVADDSDAFIAWANGTDSPTNEAGTARVTKEILITSPWIFKPGNSFVVFPDLPSTGGRVLAFETDDVDIEFSVVATGGSFTTIGNSYAIYAGQVSGATKYKNFTAKMRIVDFLYSDGLNGSSNILTGHCVYTNNVDNVTLDHSVMDNSSGAAYFIRNCNKFSSYMVSAKNNIWYPFNLESGVTDFNIELCTCDQTGLSEGVFWGGGVNIQSQQENGGLRNEHGKVVYNTFKGFYSYGSVIRCNSATNIEIAHNNILDAQAGSNAAGGELSAIRVDTRGFDTDNQNGPCELINVHHNRLVAGLNVGSMIGIYVSNQWQTSRTTAKSITVNDNELVSTNEVRSWDNAIIFHGFDGGIEDIDCFNNYGQTWMKANPIVDGAIGFVGNNSNGSIVGVHVGGNRFRDLGTPDSSYQLGIGVGQFVDEFYVDATNTIDNYFYGVRTFANSGPSLVKLNDINCPTIGSLTTLFGFCLLGFCLWVKLEPTMS